MNEARPSGILSYKQDKNTTGAKVIKMQLNNIDKESYL